MINESRKNQITALLAEQKYMTVKDLAQMIFVSEPTLRRDLTALEEEGAVKRTRGGAKYINPDTVKWPFVFRNKENIDKKRYIGKLAAEFVHDGDSIFVDSSSTCLCFAQELDPQVRLDVLTYGIPTAQYIAENTKSSVEVVCGEYYPARASIYGPDACEFVSMHAAQKCFLSGCGLDLDHGLTDYSKNEANIKHTFSKHAEQTIVLIDSSKINKYLYRIDLKLTDIDIIITDRPLPEDMDNYCYEHDIQVIYE